MRKSTLFQLLSLTLLVNFSALSNELTFKKDSSRVELLNAIEKAPVDQFNEVNFSNCVNADDSCVAAVLEKFTKHLRRLDCTGCEKISFHFTNESDAVGVEYNDLLCFPSKMDTINLSGTSVDWEGIINLVAMARSISTLDLSYCDLTGVLPETDILEEETVNKTKLKMNSTPTKSFESKHVSKLVLNQTEFCEGGFGTLINYLDGLTDLSLSGVELSTDDFDALAVLLKLQNLNLEDALGVTTETLDNVKALPLTKLNLLNTGLCLDALTGMTFPYVDTLCIRITSPSWLSTQSVGSSLSKIFPSLTKLTIESGENGIVDKDLLSLNLLKKIVYFDFSGCKTITAPGIQAFLSERKKDNSIMKMDALVLSDQDGLKHATILGIVESAPSLRMLTLNRAHVSRITGETLKEKYKNLKLVLTNTKEPVIDASETSTTKATFTSISCLI